MRKIFVLFLLAALVCWSSTSAKLSELTVGGGISIDTIAFDNADADQDLEDDNFFVEEFVWIDITAKLTDNVKGFIELDQAAAIRDSADVTLQVDNAWIEIGEFLVPQLTMKVGKQDITYDLRGDGNAFLVDIDPIATKLTLKFEPYQFDLWAAKVYENSVNENDVAANDQDITVFCFNFDWWITNQNLLNFYIIRTEDLANVITKDIWTFGLGLDYFVLENLEVYFELAGQVGEVSDGSLGEDDASHWGLAGYAGVEYTISKVAWKPYVGASFWYLSGPDKEEDYYGNRSKYNKHTSWYAIGEDVDESIIVEANDAGGLNLANSGYYAARFVAGAKPTDRWNVDFVYSYFHATGSHSRTLVGVGDTLGHELDVRVSYQYTEDLSFGLGVGYLMTGDYFDTDVAGGGVGKKDDMWAVVFNTTLTF